MKIHDIRKKSPADLKKLIQEREADMRTHRFASAGSGKKNVRVPRLLRKVIARAKTVLRETK